MKIRNLIELILLAALILLPVFVHNSYYLHLMILIMIWIIIGSGWNMLAGFTGQVSFGEAVFFGIGAYASGLLVKHYDMSAWWGLLLAGPFAVFMTIPFGWISFRLRGAYFALVTLALNEVFRHIATVWETVTGGMVGILVMPAFVSKVPYYYIALGLALVRIVSTKIIIGSKWGYYFLSIREDQDAAESLGINTRYYKMISLIISAFLTGIAGALYMNYMGFIDPEVVFSLHDISIMAILVGIVGGVGTIYGPVVGAFIMVTIHEFFRTGFFGLFNGLASLTGFGTLNVIAKYVSEAHVLGFGILVILVIMYLPNGIAGDWGKLLKKINPIRAKGVIS